MSKSSQVREMFDRIATRYDAFNTVTTFGRDRAWRRKSVELAAPAPVEHALDVATGTGKLALELLARARRVTALDFSRPMLKVAAEQARPYLREGRLRLLAADAMTTPFLSDTFDCATMGFGLRNVEDPAACLRELHRVLRPAGRLVVLELSRPSRQPQLLLYRGAFKTLFPLVGRLLSGDRHAYRYLPSSVDGFVSPGELARLMAEAGFVDVAYQRLHLDTITIHVGAKPG